MSGWGRVLLATAVGMALAGCGRVGLSDLGGAPSARVEAPKPQQTPGTWQALPPVPQDPPTVAQTDLPPPAGAPVEPPASGTQIAEAAAPSGGGVAVGRTDLLGGWKLSSGGDNCQLFMTLTTWSGGYRATTRGCSSAELQKISAWDLQGKQVSLKAADGTTVATLYSAGAERFGGQTSARSSVTINR
jgi:hypothetical protein